MRHNTDEEMRRLERLAAEGDPVAQARLEAMKARVGTEVFLDWDDLVEELDLTKQVVYHDKKTQTTESPDWILDQADQDAHYWVDEHQKDRQQEEELEDFELSEEQRQAVRDLFFYAVEKEWLPKTRLKDRIDEIVDPINEWARLGLQSAGVTERDLPTGHAVDYRIVEGKYMEDSGVAFILYPPFMTATVEAEFCVYGDTDEGRELEQATAKDVIRIYRLIKQCEGGSLIDVSGDTSDYTPPRDRELLQAIRTLDDLDWKSWPATERKVIVKIARQRGWIRHDEPDSEIGASLADSLAHVLGADLQPSLTAREKKIGEKIVKRIRGPQKNPKTPGIILTEGPDPSILLVDTDALDRIAADGSFGDKTCPAGLGFAATENGEVARHVAREGWGDRLLLVVGHVLAGNLSAITEGLQAGEEAVEAAAVALGASVEEVAGVLLADAEEWTTWAAGIALNPKRSPDVWKTPPPCDTAATGRPLTKAIAKKLAGKPVRVHLNLHNGCYVFTHKGLVTAYARFFHLRDVRPRVGVGGYRRCHDLKVRNVHAYLQGTFVDDEPPKKRGKGWRQITYNCKKNKRPCFYYVDNNACFEGAAEVRAWRMSNKDGTERCEVWVKGEPPARENPPECQCELPGGACECGVVDEECAKVVCDTPEVEIEWEITHQDLPDGRMLLTHHTKGIQDVLDKDEAERARAKINMIDRLWREAPAGTRPAPHDTVHRHIDAFLENYFQVKS
jgi:hypothetical protein